jgi:hypothetical protein
MKSVAKLASELIFSGVVVVSITWFAACPTPAAAQGSWCPRFASVPWTLTWVEERAGPPLAGGPAFRVLCEGWGCSAVRAKTFFGRFLEFQCIPYERRRRIFHAHSSRVLRSQFGNQLRSPLTFLLNSVYHSR